MSAPHALAVGLLTLLTLPGAARPCSPPPNFWTLQAFSPGEGGQVDPDGSLGVLAKALYGNAYDLGSAIAFEVACDGAPVAGTVAAQDTPPEAWWTPEAPLRAGSTCTVAVRLTHPDAEWFEPPEDSVLEASYTVQVARQPEAPVPTVVSSAATTWVLEETRCVEEAPIGSCEWCEREEVVRRTVRGRLTVTLAAPAVPEPSGYIGRLRVAPTLLTALADRGPSVARRLWDQASLELTVDLGPPDEWPEGTICYQAEWVRPGGEPVVGAPTCVPVEGETVVPQIPDAGTDPDASPDGGVDPRVDGGSTDPDDERGARSDDDGCAAAPLPLPMWLAFLGLLPVLRRRR